MVSYLKVAYIFRVTVNVLQINFIVFRQYGFAWILIGQFFVPVVKQTLLLETLLPLFYFYDSV